jgi:hypothetical protein
MALCGAQGTHGDRVKIQVLEAKMKRLDTACRWAFGTTALWAETD